MACRDGKAQAGQARQVQAVGAVMAIVAAIALGFISALFAFFATFDERPGVSLYPTSRSKVEGFFAIAAIIAAFCAGLSL